MSDHTLYILPGQGPRPIVSRKGIWSARYSYEFNPAEWQRVGQTDAQGRIIYLLAPTKVRTQLDADSPLPPGMEITYKE